jgi:hypothetical protein
VEFQDLPLLARTRHTASLESKYVKISTWNSVGTELMGSVAGGEEEEKDFLLI